MAERPIRRTVLTPADAEAVLRSVWQERLGAPVHPLVLRGLLALWDLETDGGRRMWHHNWGNLVLRAGRTDRDHFVADDSGNARRFIVYRSAEDGAHDFVRELLQKEAWSRGLHSGSPEGFAIGLKGPPAYYEASLERYAKALRARWDLYAHLTAPTAPSRAPRGSGGTAPRKRPKTAPRGGSGSALLLAAAIGAIVWAAK